MSMEDGAEVETMFIGAGCNRIVQNVSWGPSNLVSFGAKNAVAIFCPKMAQILATLPGHEAAVNCTYWLPSIKFAFKAKQLEKHYLLSGDSAGVIMLWEFTLSNSKWRHVMQLPHSHNKGVTCIAGIMISNTEAMFASTSSDCTVNVWKFILPDTNGGDCTLACLNSINVGVKPMAVLSLAELPGNSGRIVLATGGLDNKIHLYCGKRSGEFVHACELKSHTDWIRSMDFSLPVQTSTGDRLLLVTSSQDKGIRIWKITVRSNATNRKQEISLASYIDGPVFTAGSISYQISLESLLIGHEDWVYSVEWQPPLIDTAAGNTYYQPQSILSASMDKTMMIWQPEKTTGIWMNVVTVGELSHCALGFYGGHWSPNSDSILAHGYGGSFHLWKNIGVKFDNWQPQKVPSGHYAAVTDIGWAKSGEYLLSVSHDQTTRIFAPWKNESFPKDEDSWHEIARPQVHGHDINCVTVIKGKGNHRFVGGADEKVARVFEAPLSFLKTLYNVTSHQNIPEDLLSEVQILGANMSALGLSQKPIYAQGNLCIGAEPDVTVSSLATTTTVDKTGQDGLDTLETIPDAIPEVLTEPPIEEQLAWHTLWPESHKLYGHGNELFSLCCDHDGKLVASACKAQSAMVAEIWLWEVGTWKVVGRLQSHTLTVTQMEFSHDNNHLLAVSRDRHFSVFSIDRTGVNEVTCKLLTNQMAHKRIIWTCSWNPFGDEFATGSRDKTVKIWSIGKDGSVKILLTLPPFESSVMALSWAGLERQNNTGLLAVGLESGLIELWSLSTKTTGVKAALVSKFDPIKCHVASVNRLAWRYSEYGENCKRMELASCGADHCVRIFEVKLN